MRSTVRFAFVVVGSVAALTTFDPRPAMRKEAVAECDDGYLLTFSYSYSETFLKPREDGVIYSYTLRGDCHGSAELRAVAAGALVYIGSATCSGTAYLRSDRSDDVDTYEEFDCSGSDVVVSPGQVGFPALTLWPDGTYDLSTPTAPFPGTLTVSVGGNVGTQPTTMYPAVPGVFKEPRPRPLQPVISFNGTKLVPTPLGGEISIHLTATLTPLCRPPDGPPPRGRAPKRQLEPISKDFLPEDGKTTTARVKRAGKKGGFGGVGVHIRFVLEDVTREPGICLNGPDKNTETDLDFGAPANDALFKPPVKVGETGWMIETLVPQTEVTCSIAVRDYGAWGKLRAEEYRDGAWHAIKVKGSKSGFTTVPFDKNLNKIADAWEKKNGQGKAAADSDAETKPKGDGQTTGDGFSNYEEYRGLLAKGGHKRLIPKLKDLVVEDNIIDAADKGLELLENASGFHVIRLGPGGLRQDRVANAHHGLHHNGDQHGLRLVDKALGPGVLGAAVPVQMHRKFPKDCTEVQVDVAQIAQIPGGLAAGELAATIAHELAHGIGVEHHGDPVTVTANRDLLPADAERYRLFGSDGRAITIPPAGYHVGGALGGPHNDASGNVDCVMCYTSVYQWCVVPPTGPTFALYAAKPPVTGTKFCTSAKGTGMNARGKYFGDAARGNCLGQMRVKDY